jgi:hemerythrin
MEWTEDLSVGIDLIDNQHKELFTGINDLVAAIKQSTCKYRIGDVVKFLDDYIVFKIQYLISKTLSTGVLWGRE